MTVLTLPANFTTRPATEGDQQAIAELLTALEHDLYGNVESTIAAQIEWLNNAWQTAGFVLETDSRLVIAPDQRIVGYVIVWHGPVTPHTMMASPRIHPACCSLGLGTYLNLWAQQRARHIAETLPPGEHVVLKSWAMESNRAAHDILIREGFTPERYFWQMEIELDRPPPVPTWPAGTRVRNFIRNQDERATYEANAEAFATNGDPYPTFEEWRRWVLELDTSDPSLWFLAVDGNEIAGACLGRKVKGEKGDRGWIDEISVRPAWRGRGLAQALLHHAFGEYYHRNIRTCALDVDSANPSGATGVYERAGMQRGARAMVRYQKLLC